MQEAFFLQQLKSCDLFREMSEEELSVLYASMVKVNIKAGDVLVTQGEISDVMHVLLSGRLLVKTSDGKVVGQISRGQTVGEMGLITKEPRSATVVALRDCLLLKLDYAHFSQVWKKNPSVLLEVTKMIIRRLQQTLKSNQNYCRASNIVIFPGHREVNMGLFMEQLTASFDNKFRYKILKRSDFSSSSSITELHGIIQEIENQYDYLFYEVEEDQEWQEFCLECADHIYVIVNAHQPPVFDAKVLATLNPNGVQINLKKILVLLHDVWTPPSNTSDWFEQIQFAQHHHLCFHHKDDFARLLRFINGSTVGLVLGGGGTRAWAQAGAIKYLFERNISIDAYAGTSAGSISAALLTISRDYQDFLEASENISRLMKFNEYTIPFVSLLSSKSLTSVLKDVFGTIQIEDLKKKLFCVAADLVSSFEIDIHQGLLWRALRASTAIPGIYPPIYGDGKLLVDGAVVNNLPVDVMRNYFDGSGKIISIDISEVSTPSVEYNYPVELSWQWMLRNKVFSPGSAINLPPIAGTLLKGLMLASVQKTRSNIKLSDICIRPVLSGFGLLDLSKKAELLERGYAAAQESMREWKE